MESEFQTSKSDISYDTIYMPSSSYVSDGDGDRAVVTQ